MPVAIAIAAAGALGAGASIYSGNKAASAQKRAAQQSAALQQQQYQQTRADLAPYRDAGATALGNYSNLLGLNGKDAYAKSLSNYTESPFLAQLIQNTGNAVDASHAAKGGLFSGATAQAIGDRTGQLYLGDFNNYLGRLGGMADNGQNAAAQTDNFGANAANQQSNALMAAGNANANQAINTGNSINNLLGQLASTYGAYKGGAFSTPGQGGGGWGGTAYNIFNPRGG